MRPPSQPPIFLSECPRILVVDEDRDGADSTAQILDDQGYRAVVAYDTATALRAALEFQPDLILTELRIPRHHGFPVLRALRLLPELAETTVVAVTGATFVEDRHGCRQLGVLYFLKPVDLDRGLRMLARWTTRWRKRRGRGCSRPLAVTADASR